MSETKYCECAKPFIASPIDKLGIVSPRPYPMVNKWPECRACGRMVRREVAELIDGVPIHGVPGREGRDAP